MNEDLIVLAVRKPNRTWTREDGAVVRSYDHITAYDHHEYVDFHFRGDDRFLRAQRFASAVGGTVQGARGTWYEAGTRVRVV